MKYFNVNRDSKILVPYIKMAMKYNPSLKIWGSPWCPPKWMKVNNHYACHSDSTQNDLKKSGEGKEGHTQFIMKEEYLKAYALYFAKYVQTYRALGINVYAVHVQNESSSCQNFPSCVWDAAALNTFIGKYLGPEFESLKLDADIWLGTIERPSVEKIDTVITDPFSSKYVKGVGFQWAGKGAIAGVHKKYPDLHLMQTETECGDGSNDWKAAEHTWELMNHYMNNGANAYMYWNMVLDETGKSKWGWKQNSMISVDSKTHQVTYHPEFYLMKHLTHFVLPGAYCLESKTKDALAFINPDGKVILLLGNTSDQEKALQIKIDKKKLAVTLKPKSFNSLSVTLP
jgi:glucosylceramidase